MNLEPFDIEKVKAGRKVVTRDGREAYFIGERKTGSKNFPYVFEIENCNLYAYSKDGIPSGTNNPDLRIYMLSEEMYVNLYKHDYVCGDYTLYENIEDAKDQAETRNDKFLGTYKLVKV